MFEQNYQRLNEQQKLAVDTIQGPVMMIAGPGSGKTQVIAMRIANIIRLTDTLPESVLALTFTEKAAMNMRNRLVQLIGTAAYKIPVYTFHGFANEVINTHPDKFVFATELKQIDDLSKIKLLQEILDESDYADLKIFNSPYFYLRDISFAISSIKKEGLSPSDFKEIVEKHRQYFTENQEINSKTGKLKGKWSKYEKQIEKNGELADCYEKYEIKRLENGLYDYEDMIMMVNEQLANDEELLADIQEKYLYILVDEYQDTNGAQNKLLSNITSYDSMPNLFVVGDEDQAIYSFQGANIRNIVSFSEKYENAKIITTKFNYRSRQAILDASTSLIENNPDRLDKLIEGLDKKLISGLDDQNTRKLKDDSEPVELITTESNTEEYYYIIEKISNLIDSGTKADEIAVIYRNHKDAEQLITLMNDKGITVNTDTGQNLFDSQIIRKIVNVLLFLKQGNDDEKLIEILHYANWGISPLDLYKLLSAYGSAKERDNGELLNIMLDDNALLISTIGDEDKVKAVANTLLELKADAREMTPDRLFIRVIDRLGILKQVIENGDISTINALTEFHQFLEFRCETHNSYNLEMLINDLESIADHKIQYKFEDEAMYADGVHLLTAHKAKGLEFEHVFIIKAIDKHWGNKRQASKLPLLDLYQFGIKNRKVEKEEENNEERRLFFVAMTRAKQQIYISYAENYLSPGEFKMRQTLPTLFIAEIDSKHIDEIRYEKQEKNAGKLLTAMVNEENSREKIGKDAENYLRQIISRKLRLSPSALNTYIECPHRFLYQYILRAPKTKDKYMLLGLSVHRALEYYGRNWQSRQSVNSEDLIAAAEKFIDEQALDKQEKEELKKEVDSIIKDYFSTLTADERRVLSVERSFGSNVYLDNVPLKGRIDAVKQFEGGKDEVVLVDYKNSRPKSRAKLLGEKSLDPRDKNNYRQLVFYKILADLDVNFSNKIAAVELDFVKPNSSGNFKKESFEISASDVADIRNVIQQAWADIEALKFARRCEREDCSICSITSAR